MSVTTRELRPFGSLASVENLIEGIVLVVDQKTVEADGRLTLTEDEYRKVPVSVRLPFSGEALQLTLADIGEELQQISLDLDDLLLIVNVYSGFLKISEYPHILPLSQLLQTGGELPLSTDESRPKALRAARSGCRIDVAVVLGNEKPARIGQPWRKGTWLARATFHLACDSEFRGFTPRPMDLEMKVRLGVPPTATRYITLPDGIDPVHDEGTPELIEMWVDSELLANLSSRDGSAVSIAIQQQLFIDAFSAVTAMALSQGDFLDRSWHDISDTVLGGMIRAIAGKGKKESVEAANRRCESLLSVLKSDHSQFMTYVEAYAGCTSIFLKSLGE